MDASETGFLAFIVDVTADKSRMKVYTYVLKCIPLYYLLRLSQIYVDIQLKITNFVCPNIYGRAFEYSNIQLLICLLTYLPGQEVTFCLS